MERMVSSEQPLADEAVWRSAPAERAAGYHPVFHRVARALQTELRAHVDSRWNAVEHARDLCYALGVLAWISSDPARYNTISEFTYDVLSPSLMNSFFWSVRRNLPARLETLTAKLVARGDEPLADEYLPRRIAKILARLKKQRKAANRLLSAEQTLMDDALRYAAALKGRAA